mmetsp:Transcript_2969/g.8642  ORF Transcript_2969/g.8642 Transcript_2969/m.8642 type:complete len:125 (-) Transcript_2969:171-545(-)
MMRLVVPYAGRGAQASSGFAQLTSYDARPGADIKINLNAQVHVCSLRRHSDSDYDRICSVAASADGNSARTLSFRSLLDCEISHGRAEHARHSHVGFTALTIFDFEDVRNNVAQTKVPFITLQH